MEADKAWPMNITRLLLLSVVLVIVGGCSTVSNVTNPVDPSSYEGKQLKLRHQFGDPPPKGYQPLDPIPALNLEEEINRDIKEGAKRNETLLRALPNEAVRLAIGQADNLGNISFGPFSAKTRVGSYVVILDYIKYQSGSLAVYVTEELPESLKIKFYDPPGQPDGQDEKEIAAYKAQLQKIDNEYYKERAAYLESNPYWIRPYKLEVVPSGSSSTFQPARDGLLYNIPVYIGIGVRMVASVTVSDTTVDLGSLYGLAAGAQSNKLQGTLVVQTLGLSGESISPQIPLPAEINVTTIQNAIQSLATIKSKLYDDKVWLSPVILAIDDYVGRPGAKEQIVSGLRTRWGP